MSRTLILGAGFGGLTVATKLRRLLGDAHEVVLVDRSESFVMGLRKLWMLVGIGTLDEGRRSRQSLNDPSTRFLRQHVQHIDPGNRRVITDQETLVGDHLVVALGAEPRADLVPGLSEHGHDLYDAEGTAALTRALAGFQRGRIAVVIAGAPYKCPPAPFECAMLLDDHLRRRRLRDRVELRVVTIQPMLMPNAGQEGSAWMGEQLAARDISFEVGRKIEQIESGRVVLADGVLEADLIIGVPPHRPPTVIPESGLAGKSGWIQVAPDTLETDHPGVYAIGDCTQITLANGLPLPKAGVIAELEGKCVAAAIAGEKTGSISPRFDGRGFCFVEMGASTAARIDGDFYAAPQPRIAFKEESADHAEEKHRFEAERLARWFGE